MKKAYAKLDIAGYNYASNRYLDDRKDRPNRVSVGSETLPIEIYKNWNLVKELDYVVGDFIWTSWDYLGEAGISACCYDSFGSKNKDYPFRLAGSGIIDITGTQRPEVHLNKLCYGLTDQPYIGIEPVIYGNEIYIISAWRYSDALHSYSWRGCDGKRMRVVVYAKGSYVELYINNELIETKNIDKYEAHFETIYQSGTIKAIAYDKNNNIIGVDVLHTGDDSVSLKATINKDTLNADGQDLLYIDLCIADENGIVNSAGNDEIVIELKGTIALVGFGNASPCSENRYDDNAADFYYGRAQAIIRSAYEKGTGEIEIKSGRYGAVKY